MSDKLAISIGDLKDGDMPLLERINVALRRITRNEGQMRIPPEATDVDMVLCSCRDRIAELEAEAERLRPAAEAWRSLPEDVQIDAEVAAAARARDAKEAKS